MVCSGFREWLVLQEARQEYVAPEVVHSYETGFQQGLDELIARTKDANLRHEFEKMKACPIRSGASCRGFMDYALATMIKHGLPRQFDLEACLSYVYEQLLGDKRRNGQPKMNLFAGFDESRPYQPGENPLEARFKVSVGRLVRSIAAGRIKRLRNVEARPTGTLSIYGGRHGEAGYVSPDQIAGRGDGGFRELVSDLTMLLQQKERQSHLPLVDLFHSILAGEGTRIQRSRFGHTAADIGRKVIVQVIQDYARQTGNMSLLRLLDKIQNPEPKKPEPPKPSPKPEMPREERLFRSIVAVMEKHGQKVGSGILGKARRRWLERRDPSSRHPHLLASVLAQMIAAGVIERKGLQYVPGQKYQDYLPQTQLQNQ